MLSEPTPQLVGERIQKAREAAGMKIERLAVELDISADTARRYETGRTEPSYRQVVVIARLFGLPIEWFVGADCRGTAA